MTDAPTLDHHHDHDYSALLEAATLNFSLNTAGSLALFATDATGLFDLYLDSLPAERQVHNCHACRRFIEAYGGLAVISDQGALTSAVWHGEVPGFYQSTFAALAGRVAKARVKGVFLSKEATWGTPRTGDYTHLAVQAPPQMVYKGRALTAGQSMAAKREDYKTVVTALGDFKPHALDEALRILKADALARSEKFIAPVQWLRDLHDRPRGRAGENLLWRAIAVSPDGYCHPRSSVTGSLLEDIIEGLPFEDIKRKFNAKLGPLQYQRPQAPPSAGNIKAAEELFAKMGLEPALHRRFARLEELPLIWEPKGGAKPEARGGIFGHLTPKGETTVGQAMLPVSTMTWEKFARTILPEATDLRLLAPASGRYIALVTAEHADAPPILKWDRPEERNPVSWYVYPTGSPARQWGLEGNSWVEVTGITRFPSLYGSQPMPFLGEGVVAVLKGAVDSRQAGNALFPELLSTEVHSVRSTIEAFSRGQTIGGREQASACGYDIRKDAAATMLRAQVNGGWQEFRIDRWD